jgi:hypothetical protein
VPTSVIEVVSCTRTSRWLLPAGAWTTVAIGGRRMNSSSSRVVISPGTVARIGDRRREVKAHRLAQAQTEARSGSGISCPSSLPRGSRQMPRRGCA